jgi:hypothetical protein
MADPESVLHPLPQADRPAPNDRSVVYGDYQPWTSSTRNRVHPHPRPGHLLCNGSFTDHDLTVEFPEYTWIDIADLVLGSNPGPVDTPTNGSLTLQPRESRIYRRRSAAHERAT